MAEAVIQTTVVNHLMIDIEAAPELVWNHIVETFAEARKWRADGYMVEAIDDISAILGGYRMRLERSGEATDERVVHVTERDGTARRLSLRVDFVSVPHGVTVYATYHAQQAADGTRYAIDCHTRMGFAVPVIDTRAHLASAVDAMKTHSDTYLNSYLARIKAELEGQGVKK